MEKTIARDSERATRVKKVADLIGVSPRQVYRVLAGDQTNEQVLSAYMALAEGENKILEEVRDLIPFS